MCIIYLSPFSPISFATEADFAAYTESDHKKQWIKESKFARYVRFKAEAPPIILQIN